MSTEWIEEGLQRNSAIHASGQKIYRASSKKMARDCNRPHGLTRLEEEEEEEEEEELD
jgi:hypothetical protein